MFVLSCFNQSTSRSQLCCAKMFWNIAFILPKPNSCLIETWLHTQQFKWRTNTIIASRCTRFPAFLSAITSFFLSFPQLVSSVWCVFNSPPPPPPSPPLRPPPPPPSWHPPRRRESLGCWGRSHVQFIIFMTLPRPHAAVKTWSHDASGGKEPYWTCFPFIREPSYSHTHGSRSHLYATEFIRDNADRRHLTKGTPGWTFPHAHTDVVAATCASVCFSRSVKYRRRWKLASINFFFFLIDARLYLKDVSHLFSEIFS